MPNDEQPADVRGDIVGKGLVDHIVAVSLGVGMVAGIVMMCFLRFVLEKISAMLLRASAKAGEAARSTTPASGKTADKIKYALAKILLTCAQMVGTAIAYSLKIGAIGTVVGEVLTRELVAVAAFIFVESLPFHLSMPSSRAPHSRPWRGQRVWFPSGSSIWFLSAFSDHRPPPPAMRIWRRAPICTNLREPLSRLWQKVALRTPRLKREVGARGGRRWARPLRSKARARTRAYNLVACVGTLVHV